MSRRLHLRLAAFTSAAFIAEVSLQIYLGPLCIASVVRDMACASLTLIFTVMVVLVVLTKRATGVPILSALRDLSLPALLAAIAFSWPSAGVAAVFCKRLANDARVMVVHAELDRIRSARGAYPQSGLNKVADVGWPARLCWNKHWHYWTTDDSFELDYFTSDDGLVGGWWHYSGKSRTWRFRSS